MVILLDELCKSRLFDVISSRVRVITRGLLDGIDLGYTADLEDELCASRTSSAVGEDTYSDVEDACVPRVGIDADPVRRGARLPSAIGL